MDYRIFNMTTWSSNAWVHTTLVYFYLFCKTGCLFHGAGGGSGPHFSFGRALGPHFMKSFKQHCIWTVRASHVEASYMWIVPASILMAVVCVCAGVGGFKWCTWFCWVCLLLPAATMEGSKFFFFLMRLLIPFIVSSSLFSPPSILDVSCHCRHPSWGFEPVTQLEALFKLGKMVHALAMSPQRGREPWSVDTIQHLRAKLAGLGQHLSSIQRTNNFYPQRRRTLSGSLSKSPSHDTGAIQEAVLSLS